MQGVLITAYKDEEQLLRLIKSFEEKFYIIVHVDKKTKDIDIEKIKKMNINNLNIISKYNITWGSINHLYAVIDMLKIAKEKELEYIHIISASDILIKKAEDLEKDFYNCQKIYMSGSETSTLNKKIQNRYRRGCISSKMDMTNIFVKILNLIYGFFKLPKKNIGKFKTIYKGLVYVSLPNYAYTYILDFLKEDTTFLKDLEHCIIPEEFFFQTILFNSKLRNNILNDNLRYMVWEFRNGSNPAILDESDYERIIKSKYVFARKIDSKISKELINKLNANIVNEKNKGENNEE